MSDVNAASLTTMDIPPQAPLAGEQAGCIADSNAMRQVIAHADKVALADIAVMISGESGTGKEVLARYLHQHSNRASGPFVALNCAAIPESMLEALLFGHERGAFTGATEKRIGKFELAHGGTLLLDEITEMPIGLQAKLLRVLQEREVERLGSHKVIKIDVRVIATSNRDLGDAVRDGLLREDLFYRLSVFPLRLPSLRDRVEDIQPLVEHFVHKYGNGEFWRLTSEAVQRLHQHTWPGNVRELENCVQRALVLAQPPQIDVQDLCLEVESATTANRLQDKLRNEEERTLLDALEVNGGIRKATASQLGISERTLRYKLKSLRERGVLV